MSNEELYIALKFINRKKQATRQQINRVIGSGDTDRLMRSIKFDQCTDVVNPHNDGGYIVPQWTDIFVLNDRGKNLLADRIAEGKAVKRANLSLLLSLAAVIIAAATLIYTVFLA